MDTAKTQGTTASESRHVGVCLVCHRPVAIVNYSGARAWEEGYLGRHSRPGIPATSKCRGSFGAWEGKRRG